MRPEHRHGTGLPTAAEPATILLTLLFALAAALDLGAHVAALGSGSRQPAWNPLVLALRLARGKTHAAPLTLPLSAVALALIGLLVLAVWLLARTRQPRASHPDRAAHLMATPRDLEPFTRKAQLRKARRLGVAGGPGLPVGRAISGGHVLYADWEAVQTVIAGPRRMKTTAIAIPTLLAAPGAAFCTSNKPDLYAATRLPRERAGGRAWVMDPQAIVGAQASWWWNPLSYIRGDRQARELAQTLASANRQQGARTDAFFAPKSEQLVANLLLAAATGGRPVTDCYRWVTHPDDRTPATILHHHGLELAASAVLSEITSAPKQRSGVYGGAESTLSFLQDPNIARWVSAAGPADRRPQLDLASFATSKDTLYLLSREGPGSSAGVITALTMALCDAAEQQAKRSAGGRLAVPLVGILDEAANICRWTQLPSLYTHYGSRGIPLLTILQGWSQGVEVWGQAGMNKLWSASNIKTFGGGVDEDNFLRALEQLIGDYNRPTVSTSVSRGAGPRSRSTSWQATPTPIMSVADLRALPPDRAVTFPAGAPPALIEPLYWFQNPELKTVIEESISTYGTPPPAPVRASTPAMTGTPVLNPWLD